MDTTPTRHSPNAVLMLGQRLGMSGGRSPGHAQRFYRITMSLKRPFVLKSDVKI